MDNLLDTMEDVKLLLTSSLTAFVNERGENYADNADYWSNEFGIEEEDGKKITKILDLYGNEGCISITQRNVNPDIDIDKCETMDNLLEIVDDEFLYNAFQQLYIEVDEDGIEELRYYNLWNTGIYFSDGLCEPEHGYVRNLCLADIENIVTTLNKTFDD